MTFFAGVASTFGLDCWKERLAWTRESQRHKAEFQRSTLLELRDVLNEFIDAVNAYAILLSSPSPHKSVDRRQRGVVWRGIRERDTKMYKLRVRVDSEEIREKVHLMRGFATAECTDVDEALKGYERARKLYRESMELFGEALRTV